MKFRKPPLIELIAEFRWLPMDSSGRAIDNPAILLQPGPQGDAFYDAFRRSVAQSGYLASERLVPVNFPHSMHQSIFRYSRPDERETQTLFQAGPGVLSVHALPPYDCWESFRPVIAIGLKALLESRSVETRLKVFTGVTLRYIDAFSEELISGRSDRRFLSDVLQIKIGLPNVLTEQSMDSESIAVSTQFQTRLKSGLDLTLSVGPNVNSSGPQRIIMDTMISSPDPVDCDSSITLGVLERAHDTIRQLFLDMTKPIQSQMLPQVERNPA